MTNSSETQAVKECALPRPDPALKRLDRLVGTWSMEGNLSAPTRRTSEARRRFGWLPGGFFLEQRVRIDFMGMQMDALELIGCEPQPTPSPSTVYSGSCDTVADRWDVKGNDVIIEVTYGPMDAKFPGDGARTEPSRAGGAQAGAEQTVNCPTTWAAVASPEGPRGSRAAASMQRLEVAQPPLGRRVSSA